MGIFSYIKELPDKIRRYNTIYQESISEAKIFRKSNEY